MRHRLAGRIAAFPAHAVAAAKASVVAAEQAIEADLLAEGNSFNALLGFVVMFILAFLLINPVAKSGAIDPKAEPTMSSTWAASALSTP